MADTPISLRWSANYVLAPSAPFGSRALEGDRIRLPQSALEDLLSESVRQAVNHGTANDPSNPYTASSRAHLADSLAGFTGQLPNPLMFRLVNPKNGNIVYAGMREFSAEEGEIALSPYLSEALGLASSDSKTGDANQESSTSKMPDIRVDAYGLPKGTYVRLRPLEAGYNPDDWKALLERHLQGSFTTLTRDTVLSVRGVKGETFQFLVDKFEPEGRGICVVDTDLEVDIEALNEEQARETLRQIATKSQHAPGTADGSSTGGSIDVWKKVEGQVVEHDYVDYELESWDRSQPLEVRLEGDGDLMDLFITPRSSRQRTKPRESDHVFGVFDETSQGLKKLIIDPGNIELEGADTLMISIHGYYQSDRKSAQAFPFCLKAGAVSPHNNLLVEESHSTDDEQCKNCQQWIPKRTLMLHENFCYRNNTTCPQCHAVFQKQSPEWKHHWHCQLGDDSHGNTSESQAKHTTIFHTPHTCADCGPDQTFPSLPLLARHRTTNCPSKLILCQFCHLEVPQEGDPTDPASEAETALTGLTPHERADGARTTECHLCAAIVRLRDMAAHLAHHELDKKSRIKPAICRDKLCGRTLHGVGPKGQVGAGLRMGQGPGNALGLCSICFGPLYVSMHDPEGKALKRRIERRYLAQLMTGCGKRWCVNEWCKTGRNNRGLEARLPAIGAAAAALPMIKPLVADAVGGDDGKEMYFCVDEAGQRRRLVADGLADEGVWELEWCVAASEVEAGDVLRARQWLRDWAPIRSL